MLTLSIISIRYRLTHALIVWCTIWLALPFHLPIALGNPAGGNVQSGSVTINTAPGGNVTVNQRTERAVINWNSFSIKNGETTTFAQPNTRSAVLNRVTGGTTSQLDGKLNANGQVYLVNRNGVVVGKSGRISAASFTASTHDVSNAEFMNGGDLTFRGSSSASVINFGKLKATDGDVTLIARRVENHGKITARRGSVNMAGGTEILLRPGGDSANQRVFIKSSGVDGAGSVLNTGSIRAMAAELRATGGNEYALAVNNAGVIRASTVDRSGGRIVLKAEGAGSKTSGKVMNSGKLIAKARGNGKPGGSVVITGEHVTLAATSRIDVSGNAGGSGGTVNIGGGAQGKDFTIANAKTITLEQGSLINADGGTRGGSAILWSDENTNFLGTVTARGPVGGFVEVSSKGLLHFHGLVDTAGGTLLLDPASITINNGTSTSATDSILNVDELVNMLFFNDITLQATHFITVDAVIASSSPYDLKLDAPTLNLNRAISLGVGATLSGSSTIINIGASGKIQNAVHAASATTSATLNLAAATYAENIAIDKAITLTGKGDSTIINGNNSGTVFTIKPGAGKQVTFNSLAVTGGTGTFALIGTDTVVVGGGFYMISGDTAINNVTIYGNTVQDRGAGIFFNSPGTLLINNSAIRNNTSYKDAAGLYNRYGGYVRVSNTTFSNNISPSAASVAGGMLNYIDGSNAVDIINSTFTNNRANNGAGIYNYALGKSIVNITGSTFTANQSPVIGGGAILNWTEGTARINIAGSTFTGNQGQNGGGIFNYVNNSSRVIIADSIFSKNIGINNGGAIYTDIRGNASVEINNSRFTQNQAHRGGGVYVRNATGATGTEAINSSIFTGNTSTIGGGGIHTNINSITVSIQGSTFTGNSSGDRGGGIQNNSVSTARLIISNSVFTGNAATLRGGGIHNNMTGGSMVVSGSTFTNNVASDPINGGAGIHNNVSGGTVLISGSGFNGNRSAFGGGIFNTLTGTGAISISSSSFTTNTGAPSGSGGAMMNRVDGTASLTINGCTFTGNSASFGGGLFNWLYGNATMTVQDSTFQNNSTAYVNGEGGALYNYIYNSAALTIRGSTFISNTADVLGGAISNAGSFAANTGGSVMIFNSTFFGNTAVYGGAIYQTATTNSTLTIDSSTIAGNTATLGGGGLYADIVPLTLRNTIIGDNIAPTDPDVYGSNSATSIVDGGHNLIENTGNITSFTGPGTITGVDPLLAPLGFYGGPVKTMALRVGSPALNAGSTTLTVDQRGFARPSGAQEDIGAYEAQPTGTYMVLNTLDFLAVPIANSLRLSTSTGYFAEVPTNVIFNIPVTDPGYNAGTGVWTIAALTGTTGFSILHSLNINAASQPGYTGTAPVIVVNGNRAGGVAASVFTVAPGAGNTVSMNALGITGGSGIFSGGGILFSNGNLNLTNSNIYGNVAGNYGGGLYNASTGALNITNSTFANNSSQFGGGIANYLTNSASVSITGSTFSQNASSIQGGGIYSYMTGSATASILTSTFNSNVSAADGAGIYAYMLANSALSVNSSTIAGNTAIGYGGGLYIRIGAATVNNSIIALNTSVSGSGPDVFGIVAATSSYNLIGNVTGSSGFSSAAPFNNLLGTSSAPIDPLLSVLGSYGGTTQTMALLPGSMAINAGNPSLGGVDQRGTARPQQGHADIGAFESSGFTYTLPADQSTVLGSPFDPLTVTVTSNNSAEPVAGGLVNLVVPASGPTASGVLSETIDASGKAVFMLTASGSAGGPYTVSLSSSPFSFFALTNLASSIIVPDVLTPVVGRNGIDPFSNTLAQFNAAQNEEDDQDRPINLTPNIPHFYYAPATTSVDGMMHSSSFEVFAPPQSAR